MSGLQDREKKDLTCQIVGSELMGIESYLVFGKNVHSVSCGDKYNNGEYQNLQFGCLC